MKSWTIDEMLAERPCEEYTQERITELWAGRERLSLLEILDLPISWADRVWVICRPDALTHEQKAAWLERIVGRTNHTLHDGIPSVEAAPTLVAEAAARAAAASRRRQPTVTLSPALVCYAKGQLLACAASGQGRN